MRKLIKILVLLLLVPVVAFPQLRSTVIVLQLKTNGDTIPSLLYMLHDTVVYDLGKGIEGKYEECIPGKMLTAEAAFAIQINDKREKLTTIGQLEEQGVCRHGTITLTLLEIKRIFRDDPDDPREYNTPPKPYRRALFREDFLKYNNSNGDLFDLLMVTLSAEDSSFCSAFLPKQALDGTYYLENNINKYPKAICIDKTMDSLRLELCMYSRECEKEEELKPTINNLTFIIDERGFIRGLFLFVEKEKQTNGRKVATEILNRYHKERFHPAKDWITEEPVPDLVEFFL